MVGIISGLIAVAFQGSIMKLLSTYFGKNELHAGESTAYQILSNVPGVFAEELWIAFCLVTLKETGHSTVVAVMLTAIVFGAVHFQYRLGGIIAAIPYGIASAYLFLWQGSLFSPVLFHYIGNMGSFYWARRELRKQR